MDAILDDCSSLLGDLETSLNKLKTATTKNERDSLRKHCMKIGKECRVHLSRSFEPKEQMRVKKMKRLLETSLQKLEKLAVAYRREERENIMREERGNVELYVDSISKNELKERRSRELVEKGIQKAKQILAHQKNGALVHPSDVPHSYEDKFLLTEMLVQLCVGSDLNCLSLFGLTLPLKNESRNKSCTLRFKSEERCEFLREEKREIEGASNVKSFGVSEVTDKVVTTITDYVWKFETEVEVCYFVGTNVEERTILKSLKGVCEITTTSNASPRSRVLIRDPIDVNLDWLINHLQFKIEREQRTCRTPRRNVDVEMALSFHCQLRNWYDHIFDHYRDKVICLLEDNRTWEARINDVGVFNPVLPLFYRNNDNKCSVLNLQDINSFLEEHRVSLLAKRHLTFKTQQLISNDELDMLISSRSGKTLVDSLVVGLDFIEQLLYQQLASVIGKEVEREDVQEFMEYHNKQIFKKPYQQTPFCYPVRRTNFHPEGIVSLQSREGVCINTTTKTHNLNDAMKISSSDMVFKGEVLVHSLLIPEFEQEKGDTEEEFSLNLQSNAFSSFLVMIGTINGREFDAKYGIIVQNREEIEIPLNLDSIPSAGEFKKATVSISPTMQEFASMYRSMQLSSTLFAFLVVQIKPQMERVLNLEKETLTKEIMLTQNLSKLFIEYQISSDLLSNEYNSKDPQKRVEIVSANVNKMLKMIEIEKAKDCRKEILEDLEILLSDLGSMASEIEREVSMQNRLLEHVASNLSSINSSLAINEKGVKSVLSAAKKPAKQPTTKRLQSTTRETEVVNGNDGKRVQLLLNRNDRMDKIDQSIIDERNADVCQMDRELSELASIFEDLNSMVDVQGGQIDNIESNIERSEQNVRSATQELQAAEMYSYSGGLIGKIGRLFSGNSNRRSYEPMDIDILPEIPEPPVIIREEKKKEEKKKEEKKKKQVIDTSTSKIDEEMDKLLGEMKQVEERICYLNELLSKECQKLPQLEGQKTEMTSLDFSSLPSKFESSFQKIDDSIRPIIIKVGNEWIKKHSLFDQQSYSASLNNEKQKEEKNKCFDLLDALTRNGGLTLDNCSLHVVVGHSHSFARSVMNTLVLDNVNPIDKLEQSQKAIVEIIFGTNASETLK